jgi:LTXXQ motif family protein
MPGCMVLEAEGGMPMMMSQGGMSIMAKHIEGRLAFLKTELKITDAQLPLWNAFAQAMRDDASTMQAMPHPMMGMNEAATLAAFRTRSNAWVTRARLCVRCVLCWSAFPLVPGLGSANSAAGRPALFVGFVATMPESDFSGSCISGFGSSPSRYGPSGHNSAYSRSRDLPVPAQGASVHARV